MLIINDLMKARTIPLPTEMFFTAIQLGRQFYADLNFYSDHAAYFK